MKYITTTEKQTFSLGKKLANQLKGGEVVTLSGNLGTGKTIFTKGLAEGLGMKKIITSPTFILMNVYDIRIKNSKLRIKKLVHIDCYRVDSAQQIVDIGAPEYFGQADVVTVIEWPKKISDILPKNRINISLKLKKDNSREIIIK